MYLVLLFHMHYLPLLIYVQYRWMYLVHQYLYVRMNVAASRNASIQINA